MPELTGLYRGAVHDINDPENRGRLRVLVPAALGDAPSAWAEPMLPTAEEIVWKVGDRVWILFEDTDVNRPAYISRMGVERGDITPGAITPDVLGSGNGAPPDAPIAPVIKPLGYSGVQITWTPVANSGQFTRYRVLFDSVNPPVQELTVTAGTIAATSVLKDGTPLVTGGTYYAQVSALDPDGESAMSPVATGGPVAVPADAVTEDILVANEIFSRDGYFGKVSAEQIETGQLLAALAIVGGLLVGPSITIDSDNGIIISTPSGDTHFPVNGSNNTLSGDVVATALTVLGQLAIRGTSNEVSKSAVITVQSGSTPPRSGPSVTATYKQNPIPFGNAPQGLTYSPTMLRWFSTESSPTGVFINAYLRSVPTGNFMQDWTWSLTSTSQGNRPEVLNALGGVAVIGNLLYVLCTTNELEPGTFLNQWWVYRVQYNGGADPNARFTLLDRWKYAPSANLGAYSLWKPSIGVKTPNLVVSQVNDFGNLRVMEYVPDTGSQVSALTLLNMDGTAYAVAGDISAVLYTAADLGTGNEKYWVAMNGRRTVVTFNKTTRIREPSNEFNLATSSNLGLAWDPTTNRFRARDMSVSYEYSAIKDADLASNPINVVSTWRKANATGPSFADHETTISPPSVITNFPKRAWITAKTNPIPHDGGDPESADSVTVYVCKGNNPLLSTYRLSSAPTIGVTSVTVDTLPPSTAPTPPLATDRPFPNVTPASIQSATADTNGPLWVIRGDGSGRMGPLSWNGAGVDASDTGWLSSGVGSSSGYSMSGTTYRRRGNRVEVRGTFTRTGASVSFTATNGGIADESLGSLPVGFLPANTLVYGTGNWGGVPIFLYLNPTGSIFIYGMPGKTNGTNQTFATGTSGAFSLFFEND